MKKKNKPFKIIFHYLKNDKGKLITYLILTFLQYLPNIIDGFLWGLALKSIIDKDFSGFLIYLSIWESTYLLSWGLLKIPRDRLSNYLELSFVNKVSKDMYEKIDKLPCIAFEKMGVGEITNRLYTDPDKIMSLLQGLINLTCKSIILVVILVITFNISIVLFLEVIIFGIIMGFMANYYYPKIKKSQEVVKKETDKYVKNITENISGIREIKALGIRKRIEKNVNNNIDTLFKENSKIRNYEVYYQACNNIVYFLLQFIILGTCGYYVSKGIIDYPTLLMLETYIWRIDSVVESIGEFGVNYNKVVVSLSRIDDIINNKLYKDEEFGNINLKVKNGLVEFKNVSFRYEDDKDNVLNNLDMVIKPGIKNAVVGRSGNGKSTIFNLLLRYFDSTSGEILIDNVNIKDLTEDSLRKNISIIRQNPYVFNMTIKDNFKLINNNVTLKEIKEVCKKAYIDEYIESLPDKYDTVIGEGGINLSGGQKQRLAIARTLLLNTKIILFDEATSALDNESQEYIKKTIDNLTKDHTIIIVAHRLSTIINADNINVIDEGKLVASGTHKELLKNSSIYKKLYKEEDLNS